MRLWHNQNNPSQVWLSDVFCHQVLALPPLSRSMLTAPEYLESIRAWIDHPSYDELHARARIGECREYWDVVTSILMAAHEYKYVRQLSSLQRPPHASTNQDALHEIPSAEESLNDDESTEDTARDLARAIEDYLVAREKRCTCATPNSPWKYVSHVLGQSRDHSAKVRVECPACRRETTINLDGTDMSTWLTER